MYTNFTSDTIRACFRIYRPEFVSLSWCIPTRAGFSENVNSTPSSSLSLPTCMHQNSSPTTPPTFTPGYLYSPILDLQLSLCRKWRLIGAQQPISSQKKSLLSRKESFLYTQDADYFSVDVFQKITTSAADLSIKRYETDDATILSTFQRLRQRHHV